MSKTKALTVIRAVSFIMVAWCPSPLDRPAVKGVVPDTEVEVERHPDFEAPLTGLVAKVQITRFGPMATIRLYAGQLAKGQSVLIAGTKTSERVGRILRMHADQSQDIDMAHAGDVVSVTGLKSVKAGDTFCDPKAPILLDGLTCPEPVIEAVIEPASSVEQEKLASTLANMAREDPSLRLSNDPETFGYVGNLRSLSSGRATFSMTFECYGKLPSDIESRLKD